MSAAALLDEHVRRFNNGVLTGDFGEMLELFTGDGVLAFDGVPVGPFEGRAAIAEAYRDQPPDDEIEVLDVDERPDGVVAGYAWRANPGKRAGELRLTVRGGLIERLVVTFG
jgi:hypothetical protein